MSEFRWLHPKPRPGESATDAQHRAIVNRAIAIRKRREQEAEARRDETSFLRRATSVTPYWTGPIQDEIDELDKRPRGLFGRLLYNLRWWG